MALNAQRRIIPPSVIAAQRAQRAGKTHPVTASLPAPVGGWNARDALANMGDDDAVTLQNFWPTTTYVQLRQGYSNYATGLPGQVETLISYSGGATNKLFAVSTTKIYDVSTTGAVGAAKVTGLTNARFQYVNVTTAAGSFIMAVNGADVLQYFDGTTWSADGGTYTITGIGTATIIGINLFKNRVWLIPTATLKAWYLPTSSIQGAAASLDLSSIATKGGYLMAMATWTIDAGYGVDDLAVFITSNGEVIVYRGTDPSSAATWALVGVWQLGAPIGRRCFTKYGGDVVLLTYDGALPLASALQSSRLDPRISLSDKIQSAISDAIVSYASTYGWQAIYYPKPGMLIVNVPVAVGSQQQYVMNSITKSWANFTGWNANVFELYGDNLYFGGNTVVCKAWNTYADAGTQIMGTAKQAFNYFGSRGKTKRWTMGRPIIASDGTPAVRFNVNVDFDDTPATGALTYSPTVAAVWDTAAWDTGTWGTSLAISKQWQGVNGIGKCAAGRLDVASSGLQVQWMSTDYVLESGGIL